MTPFIRAIRNLFALPVLWTTEREQRRAKTLHRAYLFIIAACVLYALAPSSILSAQPILVYSAIAYGLGGLLLLRYGFLRTSAVCSVVILWLIFSYGAYTEGGITSGLYAANVMVIIFAGLVLGLRGAVSVAVLTIASGCLNVYLSVNHLIPPPALVNSQVNLLGDFFLYISLTALLTGIAVDHMDKSSTAFEREIEVRKRAEEASALAQHQLQTVFDAATEVSIIATDTAGVITVFSGGAEKMLGYRAAELVGKTTPRLFHLDVEIETRAVELSHEYNLLVTADDVFTIHARHGRKESREWTFVHKTGTHLTVNLDITAIRGVDGGITGYLGVAVDITAKKKIADALRKSEERYRLLLENMNEVVMLTDTDDKLLFVNRRFSELFGYYPEEILGRTVHNELVDVRDRETVQKINTERQNLVYTQYELEFLTKDGKKIPFLVNGAPLFDNEKHVIGSISTLTDISRRKRVEAALQKSERLLRESQEVAKIGSYVTDLMSRRWESSRTLNEILGIDESFHFTLRRGTALVAPSFRRIIREHFYTALRTKTRLEFDCQIIRHSDGALRWVSAVGEIEYAESGRPVRMIGAIQDITERKRLEQQLLQSQKLEGVGTLAGGIAHDFNNLLAMILGSAELMKRDLPDHPAVKKYLDRIIDASERGTSISRQLLVFSRPDQAELRPISLSNTIQDLKEMLLHFLPKSIAIETEIDVTNGMIIGDAGQIHQALLNLALNAADAMAQGGRLTIREINVAPEALRSKYPMVQDVPYIALSVSDTGMGIESAVLEKIFDPFFSTKDKGKGTGLGLAMVHGIVKNHNGFIDVQSARKHGTTFTLYFPSAARQPKETAAGDGAAEEPRTGTILVVEDEEVLREVLTESLTGWGYSVLTAGNGKEALAIYKAHQASIDLVITDMGMPEMGGEELYRRLRRLKPDIAVMVASGYLDGLTKEQLLSLGIKDVLTKPFKMREIQSAVHAVLAGA